MKKRWSAMRTHLAAMVLLGCWLGRFALAQGQSISGFRDPAAEQAREQQFLAVPDPQRAEQHLRFLTSAPHVAGSPEDRHVAEYIARKYREAGLETQIVEYKIWMNLPGEISVDLVSPPGVTLHAPSRERVSSDPYQDDPRILPAFNGYSPSGDVEAEVIYANYGRPEDLRALKEIGIEVRGKILLERYGENFRGVKAWVAEQNGAAGVLLYSDPIDDGWFKGDKYPQGPWRPDTGVQRGSVAFTFQFPGDPTTPGIASTPDLPPSQRTPPEQSGQLPTVPITPISYLDAWPILQHLGGMDAPRQWQGALPFTYHLGASPAAVQRGAAAGTATAPVRVRMHLKQNYAYHSIWNVIGKIRGSQWPDQWVIAGNHHDAWVYGAADPGSGTSALLETVRGIGELLKSGWRPRRSIIFAAWDAEELGLIGSTEWAEQNERELSQAVAYVNTDIAVTGPNFGASAVPSLKRFIREVTQAVPSPKGGSLLEAWIAQPPAVGARTFDATVPEQKARTAPPVPETAAIGDLGSGSDYSAFLDHLGVPSMDVASHGDYGVYHSAFDDFTWFQKFADPQFRYEQQMARFLGLSVLRLADADVLPLDYQEYARAIRSHLEAAQKKAERKFGPGAPNFTAAQQAVSRLDHAATAIRDAAQDPRADLARLNSALSRAERGFLLPQGLPHRPWFRHAIYAPGEYTGYSAVALPGVNEAIDNGNAALAAQQLVEVTAAITRAAAALESYQLERSK
jgi:N-acetylated-alpha-linked acidic dipeptidase